MVLYGRAWRVGDGIGTALIISPEHAAGDPSELAAFCLARVAPELGEAVREGDLLLAGRGFGAGEGADAAVLALQALGFAAVIAAEANPAFVEAAAVYGLPVLVSAEAAAGLPAGVVLRLDLACGSVEAQGGGERFGLPGASPGLLEALGRALLLRYTRRVAESEGYTE